MCFRKKKITEIISYLESIKNSKSSQQYSIEENISFFNNIDSFSQFLKWVKTRMPKIKKEEITELTDFENEQYSKELHESLIKLERGYIPGFIAPIVKKISIYIKKRNSALLIADLGSGSAELSRQIINKVVKTKFKHSITIVAFDYSKASHKIANNNLASLKKHIHIFEKEHLTETELETIASNGNTINVVLVRNNIFNIERDFENSKFDIAYHSFFKHHLNIKEKAKLDAIIQNKATVAFEYDGYKSFVGMVIQAFFVWRKPVLLNGAVFSNLRYYSKEEIKKGKDKSKIKFFIFGMFLTYRCTYLRTIQNQ